MVASQLRRCRLIALDMAGVPLPAWYILIPRVTILGTALFLSVAYVVFLWDKRRHPIKRALSEQ
jgi:hypothetical protein